MLKVENIYLEKGEFRLQDISFQVNRNEYFVVLGPTASGKTLLLETIAGLQQPKSGKIWINGHEVTKLKPEERNISYVPQDYALFPHMTTEENIVSGAKVRRFERDKIRQRLSELSNLLQIAPILHRSTVNLSGGEKQRVALARALMIEPAILLLDEPLTALDPSMKGSLWRELKAIHSKLKVTTLHVTHDFQEAVVLADRIGVLNAGKLVQVGTPQEIFRKPQNQFVAAFVGTENIYKGICVKREEGLTEIKVGDKVSIWAATKVEREGEVYVSIRPEDISVSKEPCICPGWKNEFKGKILEMLDRGILLEVRVDIGVPVVSLMPRKEQANQKLSIGEEVEVSFSELDVHLF